MTSTGPRLSTACLYNMKQSHQQIYDNPDMISPMSTALSTPEAQNSHHTVVSPVDTHSTYFSDEKIAMPYQPYEGIEVVPATPRRPSRGLEVTASDPPNYTVGGAQVNYINADAELPARPSQAPFWRRHLLWIIAAILLLLIIVGVAVGVHKATTKNVAVKKGTSNATADTSSLSNMTVASMPYLGCYSDNANLANRTLRNYPFIRAGNGTMSIERCYTNCVTTQNTTFFGVQYAGECWCGNDVNTIATKLPEASCDKPCDGNKNETCGGYLTMNIYGSFAANATSANTTSPVAVTNSTLHSVASSGITLKDGTWNMHLFEQKTSGRITLQVSLDGETYQPYQNVSLTIPPRVGSPLSATAEQDSVTGVVMINLFYLSGNETISEVTMSAITCPANSASCNTINNCLLPTKIPTSVHTGLTAVNINDSMDWRVYYLDNTGAVSQLLGNSSGFDAGVKIGGTGLNASSMAAVNYNSTTNNINLFYVDALSKELFKMQYTGMTSNGWTTPSAVSTVKNETWNPYSGLAAAYQADQDTIRVYYTGLNLGIYEFRGLNVSQTTNATWDPIPGRNKVWAEADYVGADLSAVGWEENVNFYQVKEDKMIQARLEDIEWTEAFLS